MVAMVCARKLLFKLFQNLWLACVITSLLHCLCVQAVATASASLVVYEAIRTNGTRPSYPTPASCGTPLPGK